MLRVYKDVLTNYESLVHEADRLLMTLNGGSEAERVLIEDPTPAKLIQAYNENVTTITRHVEDIVTQISAIYVHYLGSDMNTYEPIRPHSAGEVYTIEQNVQVLEDIVPILERMFEIDSASPVEPLTIVVTDLDVYQDALASYAQLLTIIATLINNNQRDIEMQMHGTYEAIAYDDSAQAKPKPVRRTSRKVATKTAPAAKVARRKVVTKTTAKPASRKVATKVK